MGESRQVSLPAFFALTDFNNGGVGCVVETHQNKAQKMLDCNRLTTFIDTFANKPL